MNIMEAEELGYTEASHQLTTQGSFSSGRTWENNPELNEAYDRGVNRAEAEIQDAEPKAAWLRRIV